jgi:Predicted S-adenosylmethionine-dependent methyltransferase involved in cell envelope biogenesis
MRHLETLLEFSHNTVQRALERLLLPPAPLSERDLARAVAVDGTCGNGHDTLFLAQTLRGAVPVLSFDVQAEALDKAGKLLKAHGLTENVSLVQAGHEHLAAHMPPGAGILLAMYNLGFLPGSDKGLVTRAETSIASFSAVAGLLLPGGLLCVHAYGGHAGGQEELAAAEVWFRALPPRLWQVVRYESCNKARNPEVLYLAERLDLQPSIP